MTMRFHSGIVMVGARCAGRIILDPLHGYQAFGPGDAYIATFPTLAGARTALLELDRDSQAALADMLSGDA